MGGGGEQIKTDCSDGTVRASHHGFMGLGPEEVKVKGSRNPNRHDGMFSDHGKTSVTQYTVSLVSLKSLSQHGTQGMMVVPCNRRHKITSHHNGNTNVGIPSVNSDKNPLGFVFQLPKDMTHSANHGIGIQRSTMPYNKGKSKSKKVSLNFGTLGNNLRHLSEGVIHGAHLDLGRIQQAGMSIRNVLGDLNATDTVFGIHHAKEIKVGKLHVSDEGTYQANALGGQIVIANAIDVFQNDFVDTSAVKADSEMGKVLLSGVGMSVGVEPIAKHHDGPHIQENSFEKVMRIRASKINDNGHILPTRVKIEFEKHPAGGDLPH